MKRHIKIFILCVLTAIACALGLVACGGDSTDNNPGGSSGGDTHTEHTYNQQVTTADYLCTEATCTAKAVYYYSCSCGEKGTETFESGSALGHTYVNGVCESCGDEIYAGASSLQFKLNDDGTAYSVSGCKSHETEVEIPATYNDLPVTSIGSRAFYDCTSLTSITIPDSVTSIGNYAFYSCTALTEINYNATTCADLSSSNYVFYKAGQGGGGITVNIGANVTKIPAYLFYPYYKSGYDYPPKITSVVFAEGSKCESIGDYAFLYCSSLTSITIPDSVTSIGVWAFGDCTALSYNEYDNAYYLGNGTNPYVVLVKAKSTDITTCEINANTNLICYSAFNDCSSLTSITIPDSVTSIGICAFLSPQLNRF